MGEYAKINGEVKKIGTCDLMYYLDMIELVKSDIEPEPNSLDPRKCVDQLWFKLPGVEWGRRLQVEVADIENGHGTVQLKSSSGLMMNVECTKETRFPERGGNVFRNGGAGGYSLVGMGIRNGGAALLIECMDCGAKWRIEEEEKEEYEKVLDSLPDEIGKVIQTAFKMAKEEFYEGVA